jgi:hypothetical protein
MIERSRHSTPLSCCPEGFLRHEVMVMWPLGEKRTLLCFVTRGHSAEVGLIRCVSLRLLPLASVGME